MSNLSALEYIANPSAGTTGLWNQRFSVISANFAALNSDLTLSSPSGNTFSISTNLDVIGGAHFQFISVGSTPPSYVTTAAITVEVNSAFSDYLYMVDSAAQKSSYVLGSRAGNTADGLNLWDASAGTMIVSFSKQSVRFYQQVIGPVFDLGGALTGTYNAATFGTASMSTESRIQAAINQASIDLVPRVYLPSSFLPYSASSVSFIAAVQMVREGGDNTVYDVRAYGAAGTGLRNDASAASGMYGVIPAGANVYWPGGNYLLRFPSNGSPLISISNNTIVTRFDQAARLIMGASSTPATVASERSQFLFTAAAKNGLQFIGGTFDGSRTSTTDPDAAFFYGLQCSNIRVADMTFLDSSNAYGGLIWGEAYNGSSTITVRDWAITGCTFKRSSWCMKFQNVWYAIAITNNYFEDLDLEAPQSGYSKNGDTAYSRAIRFTGYVNSTSASGPIGNAVIAGNRINRVAYAIEVWNQDATNGRNPDNAELIGITNNTILSLWGIGVNSYRDVSVVGNSWKRLKMSTAEVTAYAGTVHSMTSTGGVFGTGIEARPGYGHVVTGNVVDGQWVSGESPDLTGSVAGIQVGNGGFNERCEALVASNYIQRCFDGVSYQDTQNTQIVGNTFIDNRDAITGSVGTNSSGHSANVFRANFVSHHSLQVAVNCCTFVGEWNVEHNTIQGDERGLSSAALVRLNTTADRYRVVGNTFLNFIGAAVQDSGLTSTYVNNYYDAGVAGSSGAGALRMVRQANKSATFHNETFVRCRAAFVANGAAASGESYIATNINLSNVSLLETTDNVSSDSLFVAPAVLSSYGSSRIYAHIGSTVLPSLAFASEVSLGFYRSGVSHIGMSYGGFAQPTGSALIPSYTFSSESSLGLYYSGVSTIGLSYGALAHPSASNTTPSMTWSSETSLGFYRSANSSMALSYGTLDLTGGGAVTSIASLTIKSGSNNACGTAVLGSNGSVNVANTYVKTGDLIFLTDQTPGGTLGNLEILGIRNSSGFTIGSTSLTDTSTVAWLIIRPG